jgi:hypothetical protein
VSTVQGEGKVVYSDVCLRYRAREKLLFNFGGRIWVRVKVSVNGCTDKLVLNVESVIVGTG